MKAIYTRHHNKVYRIAQKTNVPTYISDLPYGSSAVMNIDPLNKEVTEILKINTIPKNFIHTNSVMYEEFIKFLKDFCITEIDTIQNKYKIYIDYSILEDGKEIDHSAAIKPVIPVDKAAILGVATNNECVYRQVKSLNELITFTVKNSLPYGIIETKKTNYAMKINDIAIYQHVCAFNDDHESMYGNSYRYNSQSISAVLKTMVKIYSTEDAGLDLQKIDLTFVPRKISIRLELVLANLLVVYDDKEINSIIEDNIKRKYPSPDDPLPPEPVGPDDPPTPIIPGDDPKKPADGSITPDEEGHFDWYERCRSTTPRSLLVVEDAMSDEDYKPYTMIKKSMVIKDIPDIEVGEYVIYREGLVASKVIL